MRFNQRFWRHKRNEHIIHEAALAIPALAATATVAAGTVEQDAPTGTLAEPPTLTDASHLTFTDYKLIQHPSNVGKMVFHAFEPQLIVADEGAIAVYNWETGVRAHSFLNGDAFGSRISSLRLINEEDQALLLVGSSR